MRPRNRSLWLGSIRWTISCTKINSRQDLGFFASSRFSQIRRARVFARPPAGLHPFDADLRRPDPDLRLPLLEKRRQAAPKLLAIPLMENLLPLVSTSARTNAQGHCPVVWQTHGGWSLSLGYIKPVAPSLEVVALSGHELPQGLAILLQESGLFSADPRKTLNDGQAHGSGIKAQRCGYPHSAMRRVHPQMEVLDVLPNDLHGDTSHLDMTLHLSSPVAFSRSRISWS